MKNFSDMDIINELRSRGYSTSLLFNLHDVKLTIKQYNCDADTSIDLDEIEIANILDEINYEWYIEQISQDVYQAVCDYAKYN